MDRPLPSPILVSALAGVAFALLMLFGLASVDPIHEATDQEIVDWWASSSNRDNTVLSSMFLVAAIPCFLLFVAGLRARFAVAEGGPAAVTWFMSAMAVAFAAAVLAGLGARGGVAHAVQFSDESLPGPDVLRALWHVWTFLFGVVAMAAAALAVASASYLIIRTRAFGLWFGVVGVVVAVVTLAAAAAGMGPWASPLIQLWAVAGAVDLWRTRSVAAVGRLAPAPA
ncbi:MAG: hypothetical protein ACKVVT_04035 [Dehalococcoidia bacterium]